MEGQFFWILGPFSSRKTAEANFACYSKLHCTFHSLLRSHSCSPPLLPILKSSPVLLPNCSPVYTPRVILTSSESAIFFSDLTEMWLFLIVLPRYLRVGSELIVSDLFFTISSRPLGPIHLENSCFFKALLFSYTVLSHYILHINLQSTHLVNEISTWFTDFFPSQAFILPHVTSTCFITPWNLNSLIPLSSKCYSVIYSSSSHIRLSK